MHTSLYNEQPNLPANDSSKVKRIFQWKAFLWKVTGTCFIQPALKIAVRTSFAFAEKKQEEYQGSETEIIH